VEAEQERAAQLRQQLTAAVHRPLDVPERDALKRGVRDFVEDAKRRGVPPERVIATMKRIAHEAGLRPSGRVALVMSRSVTAKDALLTELVAWCIDRYYGDRSITPS